MGLRGGRVSPGFIEWAERFLLLERGGRERLMAARQPGVIEGQVVYDLAAYLAECYGCRRILDLGYENVSSLIRLAEEVPLSGDRVPLGHWAVGKCIPHDFERSRFKAPRWARASGSVVVCAGVIERLADPEHLLATLRGLMEDAPAAILTARLR